VDTTTVVGKRRTRRSQHQARLRGRVGCCK
jgi:hypothetical protein